jgi:hypothetical protein
MTDTDTPVPNGRCFCGCRTQIGFGRFFAPGHDKQAEAAFIAVHHEGSVAQLLHAHGYGPDKEQSVTRKAVEAGGWQECPRPDCGYVGAPASIRNHLAKHDKAAEK